MDSNPKKVDDGVPNLLKLFEKAKIEENLPVIQSASQRLSTDYKRFSETDGENFFLNEDKDEEELAMILSNSGNVDAQVIESSIHLEGTSDTKIPVNSCEDFSNYVRLDSHKGNQSNIRRHFPEGLMQEDLDSESYQLEKINPKGVLSHLRSEELCTFLAAALTSAAAVRKIPKANFTYAPLSSITDGCSDESLKNPPVSVTPLGEATLSLCRTFNSINNDTNNNNFGGNSNKSCDFRSPPCKRVKLQNRPCLDFEKMHKQKACSSFQSTNRSTSNWKSTGGGLASSNNSSTSTVNNNSIINLSNNNNATWGTGGVTKLHKLDLSVATCQPSNRTTTSSGEEEPLTSLQHHIQCVGPQQIDGEMLPSPRSSPPVAVVASPSPSCSPHSSSPLSVTSEDFGIAVVTRIPLEKANGNGPNSTGRPVIKHHGNSNRGARYNHIHHNNNNNNALLFGSTHYNQLRNQQDREAIFEDDRFVPHQRTKHATPHHIKFINDGSDFDLRHLNGVIGVGECTLESSSSSTSSTGSGRRQSFAPICFPKNSSLPTSTLSNNSLFAVGSNFRSLCTAGTQ